MLVFLNRCEGSVFVVGCWSVCIYCMYVLFVVLVEMNGVVGVIVGFVRLVGIDLN